MFSCLFIEVLGGLVGAVLRLSGGRAKSFAGGVVVVALVMTTSVALFLEARNNGLTPPEGAFDCADLGAVSSNEALLAAAQCRVDVEITAERMPWARSWATADGTSRLDMSSIPSQTEVDGDWVDVDRNLVVDDAATVVNATYAWKLVPDANLTVLTVGGKAADGSSMAGWKRFDQDATISVTYNRAPNKSTTVKLSNPVKACASGTARPTISNSTPTLSAALSDPDGGNVQAKFQIVNQGTTTEVWNSGKLAAKLSGSTFTAAVPMGELTSGKSYKYRVTATDGARWSGWSTAVCEFTVDTSKPAAPKVTPVKTGVAAVYDTGFERGGKGIGGAFRFDANGSADVVSYKYGFDTSPPTKRIAGASPTVAYVPSAAGPVSLYVVSIDRAGNVSATTTYKFDVAAPR